MKLGKQSAMVLGILNVIPFVYSVYALSVVFRSEIKRAAEAYSELFQLHVGVSLVVFVLGIFYLIYVFVSETVPSEKRWLWAALLFFGSVFAFPFFWYLYIWRPINR